MWRYRRKIYEKAYYYIRNAKRIVSNSADQSMYGSIFRGG